MTASLPMYATPLTAGADARFWGAVRDHLRQAGLAAPDALTLAPPDLMAHWRDPALVFSQTCGLPYRAVLKDHVTQIGTPDYGLKDCPPGHYNSLVIARADDPRTGLTAFATARFAYNDPLSQSGWAALALEAPEVLQGPRLRTGSHSASAAAVKDGRADFASIDAVTWRHLTAASETTGLRVLHATAPTPGLPLITAKDGPADLLFEAVQAAIQRLSQQDRAVLHLQDIISLPADAYALPLPPTPEAIAG